MYVITYPSNISSLMPGKRARSPTFCSSNSLSIGPSTQRFASGKIATRALHAVYIRLTGSKRDGFLIGSDSWHSFENSFTRASFLLSHVVYCLFTCLAFQRKKVTKKLVVFYYLINVCGLFMVSGANAGFLTFNVRSEEFC